MLDCQSGGGNRSPWQRYWMGRKGGGGGWAFMVMEVGFHGEKGK